MADNYLMLDGKKYELSPELANALRSCVEPEPEKKNPFERVDLRSRYYYITSSGMVRSLLDDRDECDGALYSVANYGTDESLLAQRAMHETLNRLLWRFREEHDTDASGIDQYVITKDKDGGVWLLNLPTVCDAFFDYRLFGAEYFHSREAAEAAIEEIVKPFLDAHPDFVW